MTSFNPLQFTLKVTSRCNLNCSYCYVYNKADQSWKDRPKFMSEHIFLKTIERIREYVSLSGQTIVNILFHGGEPCLIGHKIIDKWCSYIRERLAEHAKVRFT